MVVGRGGYTPQLPVRSAGSPTPPLIPPQLSTGAAVTMASNAEPLQASGSRGRGAERGRARGRGRGGGSRGRARGHGRGLSEQGPEHGVLQPAPQQLHTHVEDQHQQQVQQPSDGDGDGEGEGGGGNARIRQLTQADMRELVQVHEDQRPKNTKTTYAMHLNKYFVSAMPSNVLAWFT